MKLKPTGLDVKFKMLILKSSVGVLTSLVIGMIVKEEIKVLDEAEEKLKERAAAKQVDLENES